jgi:hypothetical protein
LSPNPANQRQRENIYHLRSHLQFVGILDCRRPAAAAPFSRRLVDHPAAPVHAERTVNTTVANAPAMVSDNQSPTICIVGPLPPPGGGMANQCEQLLRLLRD